jgi:hypothetical protein
MTLPRTRVKPRGASAPLAACLFAALVGSCQEQGAVVATGGGARPTESEIAEACRDMPAPGAPTERPAQSGGREEAPRPGIPIGEDRLNCIKRMGAGVPAEDSPVDQAE